MAYAFLTCITNYKLKKIKKAVAIKIKQANNKLIIVRKIKKKEIF